MSQRLINSMLELKQETALIPMLNNSKLRREQSTKVNQMIDNILDELRKVVDNG